MRMWCNGSTRPFQGFRASSSLVIRSSHFGSHVDAQEYMWSNSCFLGLTRSLLVC